ncbi:flagellar basal body rod protein FlgB [Thalassobacillus pellis]|uniref:flagellar basal body rod protein FlgB n=1 Tax=Thalassobacillus pellis TaxID=748008 RepID=UPI001960E34E|nr:flagellar basal body rod protein FlgB [Thalassobacillus pellis]MBM7552756.1 flagellar basal-body rod protein FlgB [Thalassobacillus pellis]
MNLFGGTIQTLGNSLDYATQKNKVIANNIANVDTPGYKAKQAVFKDILHNELSGSFQAKRTHPRHIEFDSSGRSPFRVVTDRNATYNHNGNSVDIDKEMSELAKNQLYYQAVVDRMNGKLRGLETVIKGGR